MYGGWLRPGLEPDRNHRFHRLGWCINQLLGDHSGRTPHGADNGCTTGSASLAEGDVAGFYADEGTGGGADEKGAVFVNVFGSAFGGSALP